MCEGAGNRAQLWHERDPSSHQQGARYRARPQHVESDSAGGCGELPIVTRHNQIFVPDSEEERSREMDGVERLAQHRKGSAARASNRTSCVSSPTRLGEIHAYAQLSKELPIG